MSGSDVHDVAFAVAAVAALACRPRRHAEGVNPRFTPSSEGTRPTPVHRQPLKQAPGNNHLSTLPGILHSHRSMLVLPSLSVMGLATKP